MMDAVTKLRQFHSTTPVWAKEDRAVLLASADTIEAQAERIRVLREALQDALDRMDRARNILTDGKPRPECNWGMLATEQLRPILEATND